MLFAKSIIVTAWVDAIANAHIVENARHLTQQVFLAIRNRLCHRFVNGFVANDIEIDMMLNSFSPISLTLTSLAHTHPADLTRLSLLLTSYAVYLRGSSPTGRLVLCTPSLSLEGSRLLEEEEEEEEK